MELKIALGQMDIAPGNPESNVQVIRSFAASAARQQADLLVLPELWGSGYMLEQAGELADELNSGLFAGVAALAREYNIAICGTLLERDPNTQQIYNTATVYDASGKLCGSYRKVHLFGLMAEDKYLGKGEIASVIELPWCTGALAVCYDLRFPEFFLGYALKGASLVLVSAEWPLSRIGHWRTLLKARAIENQCFMVACNRIGSDGTNAFGGHSAVVDPWGEVLVEGRESESELLLATIDLDRVSQAKSSFPVLKDRRPEVYGI